MSNRSTTGGHMASDTRIPKAEITGLYGALVKRFSKKMLGEVPEPLGVIWHNPQVLKTAFGLGQQVQEVGRVRRQPEVVRPHGGRVAGRLHAGASTSATSGAQRGPRRGEGTRGAAVARVGRVHPAGAGRDGVCRGDEPDAADGHRRAVGPVAEAARSAGAGRADRRSSRWRTCTPGPTSRSASSRRASPRPADCSRWREPSAGA